MKSTPTKFESKIPRCSSNSNSKIPRVYREAFSKSRIPRSGQHSRNESISSSHSKPRTQVPKLNLSLITMYQDTDSPIPVQELLNHHTKSVAVNLQEEPSFEIKLANIKKQSMNIKKKATEHVSFNCSTNFEKCGLPKVDEETNAMLL